MTSRAEGISKISTFGKTGENGALPLLLQFND